MKKYNIGEIILLLMACTVAFVLCTSILAMAVSKIPTTPDNVQIRIKLIDLIQMIAGGVIGIIATMLAEKRKNES